MQYTCTEGEILGICTLVRNTYSVAQSRELECTNKVLPQVKESYPSLQGFTLLLHPHQQFFKVQQLNRHTVMVTVIKQMCLQTRQRSSDI